VICVWGAKTYVDIRQSYDHTISATCATWIGQKLHVDIDLTIALQIVFICVLLGLGKNLC
jgi:hypothetical protein